MPTEDLVVLPTGDLLLSTGEVVVWDDPVSCARALVEIDELEIKIKQIKTALKGTLLEESVRLGSKTIHLDGGMTASISSPADINWDYDILRELVAAGLPEERYNELVTSEISYKVNGSVVKSLEGANETYAEIIGRARTRVPRTPSVRVSGKKSV